MKASNYCFWITSTVLHAQFLFFISSLTFKELKNFSSLTLTLQLIQIFTAHPQVWWLRNCFSCLYEPCLFYHIKFKFLPSAFKSHV